MKVGDNAPNFTLKDSDRNDWKLSDHAEKTVVLLFYPGDNTPVCTKQLCSVGDNWEKYQQTGAEIVGISTDSVDSHNHFAQKYNFPFPLLSDESGEVIEKYQVKSWIPGRSARAVVVIDKQGKIAHYQVQPISLLRPKDDEVLNAIAKAANS
jgi:thioredoxin-dependent peroxiredoxin